MIPGISEYNSVTGENRLAPYATLHEAVISLEEMGERTISTQVRIDGGVVPDFSGWELTWRGEKFVLPTLKPQATKDNTTRNSLIDLVFISAPIHELKRFFFAEMAEVEVGTIIIDKYIASLRLTLTNFVAAFNKVLSYYFPNGEFVMNLNPSYVETGEIKEFEIDYMYIWDVLMKVNEIYDVTWKAVTSSQTGVTTIRVGYAPTEIDSHTFEYGFEGGLMSFERHVEDTDIYNELLGRGGEKNIPYRYFKRTDPYNTVWPADPDAIYELRNVYFSRVLDVNFRWYIRGWMQNSHRDMTWNNAGYSYPTYTLSSSSPYYWAFDKGRTDTKFDPVEYVKDDASIALYGVRQGKLDDDDDIFPTIQGVWLNDVDFGNYGRADEVVAVEVTAEGAPSTEYDIVSLLDDVYADVDDSAPYDATAESLMTFEIPEGRVGRLEYAWLTEALQGETLYGQIDTVNSRVYADNYEANASIIPAGGPYHYGATMRLRKTTSAPIIRGRFGITQVKMHQTPAEGYSNREVFTIWVKNIWGTTQQSGESDRDYAHRVWDPILGDKIGTSAAVHFSDGWMSASEDYEFLIRKLPEVDRSKSLTTKSKSGSTITVSSEWKITLLRSDAEYETTGLYIPNTSTGGLPAAKDHFFFTGIDVPFPYVIWGEMRVNEKKREALAESAYTNPTWVVGIDKVRAHTLMNEDLGNLIADQLDAGVRVTIRDVRFTGGDDLVLGVRSVKFTWNEPTDSNPYIVPDIDIVLSEKIVYVKTLESVKGDVNYITNNYTTSSEVKRIMRTTKVQGEVADLGNVCYLGTIIGTVSQ